MIEYIDIWKSFDVPVLQGVSLEVRTGEALAIVGPSGTGKSVLLKTTLGLIVPDRGDVRVNGESPFFDGPAAVDRIRHKIGYVFQYAALFDSMTIFDNVAAGIHEDELRRLDRPDVARRVVNALEHVNLDARVVLSKFPSELSGGMRKRVGLARAFVGRPEIILYDEPVTGLDPVNSALVHRLIAHVNDALGATSVLVTHDVEGALDVADRVALLHGGRIRFVGTPQEFRQSREPLVRAFLDRDTAMNSAELLET